METGVFTNQYAYPGFHEQKLKNSQIEVINNTGRTALFYEIVALGTYSATILGASSITFADADPDTIADSGSGFVTAGFAAGDTIRVTGTTSNDGFYTIATVAAGLLTLVSGDVLTAEASTSAKITAVQGCLYIGEVRDFDGIADLARGNIKALAFNRSIRTTQVAATQTFTAGKKIFFTPGDASGAGAFRDSADAVGDIECGIIESSGSDSVTYIPYFPSQYVIKTS